MKTIIILVIIYFLWRKYKPQLDYIEESDMWICHYNYKTTRKYFILWK